MAANASPLRYHKTWEKGIGSPACFGMSTRSTSGIVR